MDKSIIALTKKPPLKGELTFLLESILYCKCGLNIYYSANNTYAESGLIPPFSAAMFN
jgi:hypothetical protein